MFVFIIVMMGIHGYDLFFVLAQMNYSPKVLMGIMDIQEQKRNMEFFY